LKVVAIVGARPQFVKAAVVSRALRAAGVQEILVHTGQHYDENMSRVFFDELRIPKPDHNLGIGSGSHGEQTGKMLESIERVLTEVQPDYVLVYGDTNSTLAGALAAAKLHIPVAHVEAGLRSFNRRMPEEINRVLTDHVSTLLFTPTETADMNLHNEGIERGVHRVGDVMYDAVLFYRDMARKKADVLHSLKLTPKQFALATIHRAENTDDPQRLGEIFSALKQIAADLPVVLPLHPRTRKILDSGIGSQGAASEAAVSLHLIAPVSYLNMLALESEAKVVLTDSGGVQKEAFFFRVPCITLRDETEWTETVEAGWNSLVGISAASIAAAARAAHPGHLDSHPFGKGDAAKQIAQILLEAKNH
jgi:UDP-GlcNAc3NAcA epimerase